MPDEQTLIDAAAESDAIAEELTRIADAAERLLASGLTERALVVLLQDLIGPTLIGKRDLQTILRALPRLRQFRRAEDA